MTEPPNYLPDFYGDAIAEMLRNSALIAQHLNRGTPLTRRQRVKAWLRAHRPVLHVGPNGGAS